MQNLFRLISPITQGVLTFPEWLYIRNGLQRNLTTVIQFYRTNPTAVQSSHFLVRLLHAITVPQSQVIERYYDNVDAIALNVSMALKMTSSIAPGELFDGVFYGKGNAEILIADNESFDIFEAHEKWRDLVPVKVLRHARSDLGLNIPDGTLTGVETGLAVITINIPMLAIQYRAFRLNEMAITDNENESQKSIMQFIRMYVLTNMLTSHLDYSLFNRLNNLRTGAPMGESRKHHSFYLTDFSRNLDSLYKRLLQLLVNNGRDFPGTLRNIPAIGYKDMEGVMLLPEMAQTRQVVWALVIARLPMLVFLFKILKEGPATKNRREVNAIMRNLLAYKTDNVFRIRLPLELYYEVQADVEELTNAAYSNSVD